MVKNTSAKKNDDAKALADAIIAVADQATTEERDAVRVDTILRHVQAMTDLTKQYVAAQNEVLAELHATDKDEKELLDAIDLEIARQKLKNAE